MKPLRFVASMSVITMLSAGGAHVHADATKGCEGFGWNVTHELELMRRPGQAVDALEYGRQKPAPSLRLDEHYSVTLPAEDRARFQVAPARAARGAAPRGGSLTFGVENGGRYRISITTRHWIDVIADGKALESHDHQGNGQCALLHKVVEFELPAGRPLTLQLSGQDDAVVGLAITRAPAPAPAVKPWRD